jgi:hypothetical protein
MTLYLQGLALAITFSIAALNFGCGGSSTPPGEAASSTPVTSEPGSTPTFTNVYSDVLEPKCTSCHFPGGEAAFLDMSSQATAYTNLVGVKADGPSCGMSGLTRVIAGNAARSLLYEKVSESNPPCGSQMPLGCSGSSCLTSTAQREIADWINGAAPND